MLLFSYALGSKQEKKIMLQRLKWEFILKEN